MISATSASVVRIMLAIEAAFCRAERNLGRVDYTDSHHIAVGFVVCVKAVAEFSAVHYLVNHHAAVKAGVYRNLTCRFLKRLDYYLDACLLVASTVSTSFATSFIILR